MTRSFLRDTVTLTIIYILVMTHGLYEMFPGPPETFPENIGCFPGPFFDGNVDILAKICSYIFWVSGVLLCA